MKMGNESSYLTGLKVDDKAIEVTDFWIHHAARVLKTDSIQDLSVFVSDYMVCGPLWDNKSPLGTYTKNLMLYRHPCILKYISSWNKGSKFYLAVERVRPLSHVIATQSTLQVCIGLYSILKALIFLHTKAQVSHNNICSASIYVTKDGSWKLGGLEFLCKTAQLTKDYLAKTRAHRYENAIDSNEDKHIQDNSVDLDFVDQYAFGVLVEEILRKRTDNEIPVIKTFYDFCKNEMQAADIKRRPNFSNVISHPFFNQEFVTIYSFLNELPLKSEQEKSTFFSNLIEKLKLFPDETVAENLGDLLLSRLVLLDNTARQVVIPVLLCPKGEHNEDCLFSVETFQKYLIPKLLQIFKVTDLQIRELLLLHLKNFLNCFTNDQLKNHILPELLLGIKDRNDNLVAMTLRSLADLVPILGSETVIGGKRIKLFSDGRPKSHVVTKPALFKLKYPDHHHHRIEPTLPVLMEIPSEENDTVNEQEVLNEQPNNGTLPERPSPDGGEDFSSSTAEDIEPEIGNLEDVEWSDWDMQEQQEQEPSQEDGDNQVYKSEVFTNLLKASSETNKVKKKSLPDILELDIKSNNALTKTKHAEDEIDFFEDMEPVIDCSNKFLINGLEKLQSEHGGAGDMKLNFNVVEVNQMAEDGWDDDLDWNVDNTNT